MSTTRTYKCVSDRYDRYGGIYDSVEDFLAMCREAFGEEPDLQESAQRDGRYFDEVNGEYHLVLTPFHDEEA